MFHFLGSPEEIASSQLVIDLSGYPVGSEALTLDAELQ